jgi:hypothetical protein
MRDMYWAFSPSFVAPYAWLLIAMVAVTIVRAALLSWHLLGGVLRRRVPLDRVLDGSVPADDLAHAALANLVSHEAMPQERLAQLRAGPRIERDTALRTLRAADARFDYLWQPLAIGVSSTWGLARLTLIAAAFTTGCFPRGSSSHWAIGTAQTQSRACQPIS